MKAFCSIFTLLCCLSTLAQGPFKWPDDLQVDPNDYYLGQLSIKKITQYKKYGTSWKFADSTEQHQSHIDYIIEFDSLLNITSFKYDLLNHLRYSPYFGDSLKIDSLRTISAKNETPLLFLKLNDQWLVKDYWEVKFFYDI